MNLKRNLSRGLLLAALCVGATAMGVAVAQSATAVQDVAVPINSQFTLAVPGRPARVAVGDPKVVDVKVLRGERGNTQLLLVGLKPGLSTLRVWLAGRGQQVLEWNVHVQTALTGVLDSRGLSSGARVDAAGSSVLVSGQSASAIQHEGAAQAAADAMGKDGQVVDLSTVNTPGTVQVDVKIVEVDQSVLKEVGINLSGNHGPFSGGFDYSPSGLSSASTGAAGFSFLYSTSSVQAMLQLLQTDNLTRVLAEPTLVALSGQSASFLAGGEIPVPESGGLGTQNIVYKNYGIGLSVTPTVLAPNRIALKVAPEASELDPANGTTITNSDGSSIVIPALTTRRADTTVELGDGQSFIIGGLVSRETKAEVDKVPFLGDLPIIGAFFRSIDYSQEDKELIIIVTPHLVRPIADGTQIPLPGGEEVRDSASNAWGYYLLGIASKQKMPGFSR